MVGGPPFLVGWSTPSLPDGRARGGGPPLKVLRRLGQPLYLTDGLSVSQTATQLGWANPTSFIEAFTAILGQTPGRFLRHGQASEERGALPG
jgi:AraC-like DNA-binding protein